MFCFSQFSAIPIHRDGQDTKKKVSRYYMSITTFSPKDKRYI